MSKTAIGDLNLLRVKTITANELQVKVLPPLLKEFEMYKASLEDPSEEAIEIARNELQGHIDQAEKHVAEMKTSDKAELFKEAIDLTEDAIVKLKKPEALVNIAKQIMRVEFMLSRVYNTGIPQTYADALEVLDEPAIAVLVGEIEKAIR